MVPHKLTLPLCVLLLLFIQTNVRAQARKVPTGGRLAIVVDERLAALRSTPDLSGKLVRRLSRGRLVAIRSMKVSPDGITFLFVNLTTRTRGWIQRESVVSSSSAGDDQRLLKLMQTSHGFDRIARARIFLDHFRRSALRPQVLLLMGDTAEGLAAKLTVQAQRKLSTDLVQAPEFSYFLNYSGLDRYNRLGVRYVYDGAAKQFRYDGWAWREILRRHPRSPEALEAHKRLASLPGIDAP